MCACIVVVDITLYIIHAECTHACVENMGKTHDNSYKYSA